MKAWKRNAVVAAVLVFVCAGIYLNWAYGAGKTKDLVDTLDAEKILGDDTLVLAESNDNASTVGSLNEPAGGDYFAQVRLSRQTARDEAVQLLQETISYAQGEDAAQSSAQLEGLVSMALSEAQIESLVIAKGYQDCVAYMTDDGISVAVAAPAEGLTEQDVACIADIVTGQTSYKMTQIRVIGVEKDT